MLGYPFFLKVKGCFTSANKICSKGGLFVLVDSRDIGLATEVERERERESEIQNIRTDNQASHSSLNSLTLRMLLVMPIQQCHCWSDG